MRYLHYGVRPGLTLAVVGLAMAFAGGSSTPAFAQRGDLFRESPGVKQAFRDVVRDARDWVVRVYCDNKQVALGTVVGADGWIVTKASELTGEVLCKLGDDSEYVAKITGVQNDHDLAMLKIECRDLAVCQWETEEVYYPGQWVATAGSDADPLALGVVSVTPRRIPALPGVLGVRIDDAEGGVLVTEAMANKSAAKAGLKDGDIIVQIDDIKITNRQQLVQTIQKRSPGSLVRIKYLREKETLDATARLGRPDPSVQDRLGGKLSERSDGFPLVLQHDSVLRPEECGGPLLGLDGKALALNIARSGRVMSFAIPGKTLLALLPELQSGKLAPPAPATTVVNVESVEGK